MSYSGAPSNPNYTWLYVSDPFTDGIVTSPSLRRELFCYAYSQGYTGLVMYEMSQFISGGAIGPTADWINFIQEAKNNYNLDVAAAFGGPSTVTAVVNWNNANPTAKFFALVSEIEWWNYSYNLPFQDPDTGAYSFFDTVKALDALKPSVNGAGLSYIGYIGFTKGLTSGIPDLYESKLDILGAVVAPFGVNDFIVRGDFTAGQLTNGRQFSPGQKIVITDYPTAGVDTTYTLSFAYPVGGNTRLRVAGSIPTTTLPVDGSGNIITKVRTHYNILSSTVVGSLLRITVPGDKTFRFETEFNPDTGAGNTITRGSIVTLIGTPGSDGVWKTVAYSYDVVNNTTTIDLQPGAGLPVKTPFTNAGFIDPDTFGYVGPISTFNKTGIPAFDRGRYYGSSELGQLYTLFDEFWLHCYIVGNTPSSIGTPRYSRLQTRSLQLAAWAQDAFTTYGYSYNTYVGAIVSAEPEFSKKFFEGKDSTGTVVYTKKNVKDAYKYIVTPIAAPAPPQGGSPLYLQAETNPIINAWLDFDTIALFKDKEIIGFNTGNGPNLWIEPYAFFTAVNPYPGVMSFSSAFCDDCIRPGIVYTFSQSFLSKPVGSAATISFPTNTSIQCDGNGAAVTILNYDLPGLYKIEVQINDGQAVGYRTVDVFVPPVGMSINVVQTKTEGCPGTCTSSVILSVTGGTPNYTYQLFDGNNNPLGFPVPFASSPQTIINLCESTYIIRVVDSLGLVDSKPITIVGNPYTFDATLTAQNPLCNGFGMGSITANVTPGVPSNYFFSWSNGTFGNGVNTITGLSAGSYNVSITDGKGCTRYYNASILDPPALVASYIVDNVKCAGESNGSITIAASGGTPPYTYSWYHNPFINTPNLTNIPAGSYALDVLDSNGCKVTLDPIVVGSPAPISFSISGKLTVCNNNGNVTYTASSPVGVAPFTFTWSGPDGVGTGVSYPTDFSNDRPGLYTISCTMTDANGCTYTDSIDVNVVTWNYSPTIVVSGGPLTSCSGSDVTIEVVNPQGLGEWNHPSLPNTPIIVIPNTWFYTYSPGQPFTFIWTEANAGKICVVTASVTIQPPSLPTLVVTEIVNNPCGGPTNVGAIDLTTTGGCPPYTYAWTGPGGFTSTSEDISGLVNGTYTCVVTDSGIPVQTDTVTVTIGTSILDITGVVTNTGCAGINTGAINVTTTGGTAPFVYLWNDGATTEDRNNLPVGTYTVNVTDFYGCTATETFTIVDSNVNGFTVTSQSNPTIINGQDGTITLNVTSTDPSGYPSTITVVDQDSVNWGTYTVTFDSSILVSGLPEGTYTITMTNALGCVTTEIVTLVDPVEQDQQDEINECIKSIMCCLGKKIASVFRLYNNGHPNIECLLTPLYTANSILKSVRCWYPEAYSFGGEQGFVVTTGYSSLDHTTQLAVYFLGQLLFTYVPNVGDTTSTKVNAVSALFQAEGFDTMVNGDAIWIYSPENSYYNGLTFNFVTNSFPVAGNPIKGPVVQGFFMGAEDVCYAENIATSVCLTEEQAGDMFNQLKCFCNG